MQIPDTIPIAGIVYEVKMVESREELASTHVGNTFLRHADMVIDKTLDPQVQGVTFTHEWLEAVFSAMRVKGSEVYIDEDFVDRLSHLLYQGVKHIATSQPTVTEIVEYNPKPTELNEICEETLDAIKGNYKK